MYYPAAGDLGAQGRSSALRNYHLLQPDPREHHPADSVCGSPGGVGDAQAGALGDLSIPGTPRRRPSCDHSISPAHPVASESRVQAELLTRCGDYSTM